jgi:predicted nucleotidyltransferase
MVDIEELKPQILKTLIPLKPDKIILFGSYVYGTPNEDNDIDLFLLKDNLEIVDMQKYQIELQKKLFDIQKKYLLRIDLFVDNTKRMTPRIEHCKDQFYNDILIKGTILYGK